ncbi:ATP-binding protein [Bifidobacterium avesanii]|uniref:AAA family ATPase n=1 Tax=Bifidobacterium avesanii TaxID=1798157 RepID=A0A7K3TJT6_9BIFI|nr:ATP-binding protein [Bifidobacterium avesanii]KAB8286602.1 ATPase AAA [Bifidobacterium avesanii]NEG79388.1 AAA family ATPase [Bifidobacterium avesanii]
MLELELLNFVHTVQTRRAEGQTVELKAANHGCPTKLYDTLSSFSNQDDGGVILFGVDEDSGYEVVGVYDVQDLMKHVTEQCNQMHPRVRAVFTACEIDGKYVVSAEIPAQDVADRPCFYEGKGRYRGSYVRVGDADEPMTEYEIYSYEAFRRKYEDELRVVERADADDLDKDNLLRYELALKQDRPHLAQMDENQILDLMSVIRNGHPTLAGTMLFAPYPQAFFPQYGIIATRVPGTDVGDVGDDGERFIDNVRIEGNLEEQLRGAVSFVRKNMRTKTVISPSTGERKDKTEYPIEAVRELALNALIHRDYSIHTQGMPIQLQMFEDRLVITNPGGLYGRLTIDQLGKVQPDTRNPVIANAMEVLGLTENRYSGIPTVRRLASESGLPAPLFENGRGEFRVTLRVAAPAFTTDGEATEAGRQTVRKGDSFDEKTAALLDFCRVPRTRREIFAFLGLRSSAYAMRTYVSPLVDSGRLVLGFPDKPRSSRQTYRAA